MPRAAHIAILALAVAAGCREATTEPDVGRSPEQALAATAAVPLAFSQVVAGGYHSCGVTTDSRLYCWGLNTYGQVGDGTRTNRKRPVRVGVGLSFRMVSAGDYHTCAVTTTYRIYCWGRGNYGQLGNGISINRLQPTPVYTGIILLRFSQVSAGGVHTCALTTTQRAYCWGRGSFGMLGNGGTTNRAIPVPVSGKLTFLQVTAGGSHSCGITTVHRAYCWGNGNSGQLGNNSFADRLTPVAVYGSPRFAQISAGGGHTCGLVGYRSYCWGDNSFGQLGDGTVSDFGRPRPHAVLTSLSFRLISPGQQIHTCAVSTTFRAYCWGSNDAGELGLGPAVQRALVPTAVLGGLAFTQVSGGGGHSCGLTTGSRAYCWGWNPYGQLGDGTLTDRSSPVAVIGP